MPCRSSTIGSTALRSVRAAAISRTPTGGRLGDVEGAAWWRRPRLFIADRSQLCSVLDLIEHAPRPDPRMRRDHRRNRTDDQLFGAVARLQLGGKRRRELRQIAVGDAEAQGGGAGRERGVEPGENPRPGGRGPARSEERRVGKEGRSRWAPYH